MKKTVCAVALLGTLAAYAANTTPKAPEKAALCVACHGPQGNSSNPAWPNLAGQHPAYTLKQLRDMEPGKTRPAPTMSAIVATLSDEDRQQLAAYYASLPLAENTTPDAWLKRGESLYRGGDFDKRITACIACHGPQGTGNAQAGFPSLSGQNAAYTIAELQAFKNKTRHNDLNSIMEDISSRMDTNDMEAVAYYIQGLH